MYRPILSNYVASFLYDAKKNLDRITTHPSTYMKYARYVIAFLSIANETLLKHIARDRLNSGQVTLDQSGQPNYDPRFDRFLRREFSNNQGRLLNKFNDKSIKLGNLIQVYRFGTTPRYFGLNINDNDVQMIDDFREVRNTLIHRGAVSPQDLDTLIDTMRIITHIFQETFQNNYRLIEYIERINQIPAVDFYNPISEVAQAIMTQIESPNRVNWIIHCLSKLIICILLSDYAQRRRRGGSFNLIVLFREFSNLETETREIETRPPIMMHENFRNVEMDNIYDRLIHILDSIDPNRQQPERILGGSEINLIRRILRDYCERNAHFTPEQLTDDESFSQILNANTQLGVIKSDGWDRWVAKYHLEEMNDEEKQQFLTTQTENFRNEITIEIADQMFELALFFLEKHIERYFLQI